MYNFCKIWIVSLIACSFLLSSCSYVEPYILDFYEWTGFMKPDNFAEEIAEDVVEHYTLIDVDFTPSTEED